MKDHFTEFVRDGLLLWSLHAALQLILQSLPAPGRRVCELILDDITPP